MQLLQAFLNGLLVGGVYALIASGMALIFGVMRLVNFAHGAFLMLGTYLSYYGWTLLALNPYLAFPLWGAALFLLALGTYRLLVRRVMGQSDFLQILLTEGISLTLIGLAQLAFGADYRQINLPLANHIVTLGPLRFNQGYILSFAVSVALVLGLRAFLDRTEMGRAIRAVAQNRSVAPLMGIRVERVSGVTFGLGVACAGVAGALLLPIFWTNPTVGSPYTLKSFVIVVLGGMGSVQGAALGGLLLGVAEQFTAYTWADRYAEVVNFVLFLGVLLFRPQGLFGGKEHMSLLRRNWVSALLLLFLVSFPLWMHDGYILQLVFRVMVFAVLGIAWNFVGGYAGQLSLGHVAYFGIGAYAMTLSTEHLGWNPWLGVILGGLLAMVGALIIGSITFRLRGPYFTLSTIAAAEILRVLIQNQDTLTHGAVGTNAPLLFQPPNLDAKFFWGGIPLLAAALGLSMWIHVSRFGYRLRAIRENEDTAMAVGVNPAWEKLKALMPSALFTALAGSLYASYFSFVGPDTVLTIDISVQAALIAMLGGAGTVWGPVLGSVVLTLTSEVFKTYFEHTHLVVYGLLLIVVVLVMPGGVVSLFQGRWKFRREAGPIGSVQG